VITCDLAIIGSGPGGYVAATRAGQLGMKTVVIENTHLGGICLNRGCIPTKAMLHSAAVAHEVRHAATAGVVTDGEPFIDYEVMLQRRDKVVAHHRGGVRSMFRGSGVQVLVGKARLTGPNTISVEAVAADIGSGTEGVFEGTETVEATHIIVATGSKPAVIPVPGTDHPRVLDSDGALALTDVPASILVVGAGAIGCEWSMIFGRLGSKVTLVEMLPTILPREEKDISSVVAKALKAEGITVHAGTSITAIKDKGADLEVELSGGPGGTISAEYVLIGAGRAPMTEGLGLEAAGVQMDPKGWIPVDDWMQTNVPSVLAVGDVTGRALLAHVASRQGIVAVETLAGLDPQPIRANCIPSVTYTDPEVASVGLTEAQATEQGISVVTGKSYFRANGRASAQETEAGLVKVVAEAESGRLLGVHMVGSHVGELVAEAVLALEMEVTLDEWTAVVRAHPTLSEAPRDAALMAVGRMV